MRSRNSSKSMATSLPLFSKIFPRLFISYQPCFLVQSGIMWKVYFPENPMKFWMRQKWEVKREWRSGCTPFPNFEEFEYVKNENISTGWAPLPHLVKGLMELPGGNTFKIHGAWFPLWLLDKSQRGEFFTFSTDTTHNFVVQSILYV